MLLHKRRFALSWGPALVALVVAALAYNAIRRAGDFGAEARRSTEIVEAVSTVMLGLDDAETGQRGYLITGDSSYLAPFALGQQIVPPTLDSLGVLMRGDAQGTAAVDSLRSLSAEKFTELNRTIRLSETDGVQAALGVIAAGRGKLLMDDVRGLVARLSQHENDRLRTMSALQENERRTARIVLFLGITLAVLLGGWANARVVGEAERLAAAVRERDAANATLQDQAAELEAANSELLRSTNALQEQTIELEQQAEEAQALSEELELSNEELNRANNDLEERSRIASAAEEVARSASKAKSDFLAMMSHEIRTPINAVVGYSELLALGLSGPLTTEQSAQVERIQQSTRHLLQLVNEILDLAKIESGTLRVESGHGAVGNTVDLALDLVRTQADAKGITLLDLCDGTRSVKYVGDQDRVRQIVLNLLSNAVKFTNPGGTVTVTAHVADWPELAEHSAESSRCVGLTIADSGIGIAPEHFGNIFEPFTQIETDGQNPYTRQQSGTGLGLPISRQLATLMGGALTVESSVGSGSSFTLWLPVDGEE